MTSHAHPNEDRPLQWLAGDTEQAKLANSETVQRVESMIATGSRKQVLSLLESWPPHAVMSCFGQLRTKRAHKLLKWMSDDLALTVLSEIDPKFHMALFDDATKAKFTKLVRGLDRDRALAILLQLPREYAQDLIADHPASDSLRAALADDDSAEAAMRQGAVVARAGWSIGDVIYDIRLHSDRIEKIDRLLVVDEEGSLKGYLKLRDLILHDPETPVSDVVRSNPVAVTADMDRAEVLALARRRKESVIAVVDGQNRLLGAITSRELAEIARREADEDMLLMGGVSPVSTGFDRPFQIVRRRLPWLLAGLIGALIAASVIGSFEDVLSRAAILASFIPVVMASAGNAGIQASTVSIQALGDNASWPGSFADRLRREVLGACLNGMLLGAGVCLLVILASYLLPIERPAMLGLSVGLALLCVVTLAATVGTIVPVVLKALKLDPAVATGIFILAANDISGVLIFFLIASHFYL